MTLVYTVAIYLEDLSVYCGYIFRGPWYILWLYIYRTLVYTVAIYLQDLSVYTVAIYLEDLVYTVAIYLQDLSVYTVAIYLDDLGIYCGYIFTGPWYILWLYI